MAETSPGPLQVMGCADKVIGEFILGVYVPHSSNHGKAVYKKEKRPAKHDIMIYFWNDDEDPEDSGWWFGPNVGGEQVWAFHPDRDRQTPPLSGWVVPHDAEVDPSFILKPAQASAPEKKATTPVAAPPSKVRKPTAAEAAKAAASSAKAAAAEAAAKALEVRVSAEKRKRLEEENKKKWEEDSKRRKEETRREREERKKKEAELRKQEDESRRLEEVRRKDVEKKRKADEEHRKTAAEEREIRKRENEELRKVLRKNTEEERKKLEEEAELERQQRAANKVLECLHKISTKATTREEFWTLRIELGQVMKTDLPNAGSQQDFLNAECKRVLEYARNKVDIERHQELIELRKKERTPEQVVKELEAAVAAAESNVEKSWGKAAPLFGKQLEESQALELCLKIEKAGNAAIYVCASARAALLDVAEDSRVTADAKKALDQRLNVAFRRVIATIRSAAMGAA